MVWLRTFSYTLILGPVDPHISYSLLILGNKSKYVWDVTGFKVFIENSFSANFYKRFQQ